MEMQSLFNMFTPLRSAPNDLPFDRLADFYGALKGGDDYEIGSKLRALAKTAKVKTPSWEDFIAAKPHFSYVTDVYDESGRWVTFSQDTNHVTREGLGYLIGCGFQVTSPASKKTNFFVTQVKSNTSPATTNTASSPSGTEIVYSTDVSQTVRPTLTLGAISTGTDLTEADNSASLAVFNHLTTITAYGLQLFSVSSGGSSSGYTGDVLYGFTLYSTALAVASGYTVSVSGELSCTAG